MPGESVHACLGAMGLMEGELAKCSSLQGEWALVKVSIGTWLPSTFLLFIIMVYPFWCARGNSFKLRSRAIPTKAATMRHFAKCGRRLKPFAIFMRWRGSLPLRPRALSRRPTLTKLLWAALSPVPCQVGSSSQQLRVHPCLRTASSLRSRAVASKTAFELSLTCLFLFTTITPPIWSGALERVSSRSVRPPLSFLLAKFEWARSTVLGVPLKGRQGRTRAGTTLDAGECQTR